MVILDTAGEKRFAARIVLEESPVIFFGIGVIVPSGGEHDFGVAAQPGFEFKFASQKNVLVELGGKLQVEGVLTGFEALVIMNASLSPKLLLLMQDIGLWPVGCVDRSPKDAVGMRRTGREIPGNRTVIGIQCVDIVIPMHRHSYGVRHQRSDKCIL